MQTQFGPWTTCLASPSQLSLSASWSKRLARLSGVAAVQPGCTLGEWIHCAAASLLFLALPLFLSSAELSPGALAGAPNRPQAAAAANHEIDVRRWGNARARERLDQETEGDFDEAPLEDVLQYLKDYHNVNIAPNRPAIRAAGIDIADISVTLRVSGISLRSLLKLLLEPFGLSYYVEQDAILVTTRELADKALEDIFYPVDDIVDAGIEPADLGDVIERMVSPGCWNAGEGQGAVRTGKTTLEVLQKATVHDQIGALLREIRVAQRLRLFPVTETRRNRDNYSIRDVRARTGSDDELISKLGEFVFRPTEQERGDQSKWSIEGDELSITEQTEWSHAATSALLAAVEKHEQAWADRRQAMFFDRSTRERAAISTVLMTKVELDDLVAGIGAEADRRLMRQLLARPTTVKVEGTPLIEALNSLQRSPRLNFIPMEARFSTEIGPETPVTLSARDEPVRDVIERILRPLKLGWIVGNGSIYVAKQADLDRRALPRVYRTKELTAAGRPEQELLASIRSQIEPESWTGAGGSGEIAALPGLLIVTNNPRVQLKIDEFLESLFTAATP